MLGFKEKALGQKRRKLNQDDLADFRRQTAELAQAIEDSQRRVNALLTLRSASRELTDVVCRLMLRTPMVPAAGIPPSPSAVDLALDDSVLGKVFADEEFQALMNPLDTLFDEGYDPELATQVEAEVAAGTAPAVLSPDMAAAGTGASPALVVMPCIQAATAAADSPDTVTAAAATLDQDR